MMVRSLIAQLRFHLFQKWWPKTGDENKSIYDFELTLINGEVLPLSKTKGSKLLIVNTASQCAYTPQLAELQQLHDSYYPKLIVLAFPSNDFLWQEPGSNAEIADFCVRHFGATFPIFEKISVNGRKMHPLYRWLAYKSGKVPLWNFCKYLVSEQGEVMDFFPPKVKPLDKLIIEKL